MLAPPPFPLELADNIFAYDFNNTSVRTLMRNPDMTYERLCMLPLPPQAIRMLVHACRQTLNETGVSPHLSEFMDVCLAGGVYALFQPVRMVGINSSPLYYELLFRAILPPDSNPSSGPVLSLLRTHSLMLCLDKVMLVSAATFLQRYNWLRVGVNVSQLHFPSFATWHEFFYHNDYQKVFDRLFIEILEGETISPSCEFFSRTLKSLGIRIALDDFTSTDRDNSLLELVAPEVVKIDASILWAARSDPSGFERLKRMTSDVRSKGSLVVIEGVENSDDVITAQSAGISWGQGYYLLP